MLLMHALIVCDQADYLGPFGGLSANSGGAKTLPPHVVAPCSTLLEARGVCKCGRANTLSCWLTTRSGATDLRTARGPRDRVRSGVYVERSQCECFPCANTVWCRGLMGLYRLWCAGKVVERQNYITLSSCGPHWVVY